MKTEPTSALYAEYLCALKTIVIHPEVILSLEIVFNFTHCMIIDVRIKEEYGDRCPASLS